jgi:hypothetical protein
MKLKYWKEIASLKTAETMLRRSATVLNVKKNSQTLKLVATQINSVADVCGKAWRDLEKER